MRSPYSLMSSVLLTVGVVCWARAGVDALAQSLADAGATAPGVHRSALPHVVRRAGGSAVAALEHARIASPAPADATRWTPPRHVPAAERSWVAPGAELRWRDPNAERINCWRGDVRDCTTSGPELGVAIDVKRVDVERATESFGFRPDEITFRYRTQDEYDAGVARRDRLLDARGVRFSDDIVSPDYPWMIRQGVPTVAAMADRLEEVARRSGATSVRGRASIMAGFTQALAYEENLEATDDEQVEQMGVMLPAATLDRVSGDCDSKAVLLCALLQSSGVCDSVLVHTEDHTLVGLGVQLRSGDDTIRAWRRPWVMVETTDRWPVGRISRRHVGEEASVEQPSSKTAAPAAARRR